MDPVSDKRQKEETERQLQRLKETDQQIALCIGALAGIPTRDRRGNVLDALWVKYSEQSVVGMLLETNDIRKILLGQIEDQLKARKDLIQEVEQNEIVCQWLMAFTASWEHEYSKQIIAQFDIGQMILSAMSETYFEIIGLLDHARGFPLGAQNDFITAIDRAVKGEEDQQKTFRSEMAGLHSSIELSQNNLASQLAIIRQAGSIPNAERELVREATDEHDVQVRDLKTRTSFLSARTQRQIHRGDEAAVRLLFRHENTRSLMCRIAGAMLRKQEVCNKSGAYSAKVQRNDISQQKNAALDTFCAWVLNSDARLEDIRALLRPENMHKLIPYILDHKGSQTYSDGLHLSHVRAGRSD